MGLFGWGKKKDEEKEKADREHTEARRKMEEAKRKGRQEAGLAPASTVGPGGNIVPAATGGLASGTDYTVQSGDSLSRIAQRHLGDANRWPEIHQANRAVIGDNPDLIKPGQRLRIPGGTPPKTV